MCIYIYTYTHTHTCAHTHMCVYTHTYESYKDSSWYYWKSIRNWGTSRGLDASRTNSFCFCHQLGFILPASDGLVNKQTKMMPASQGDPPESHPVSFVI